MSEIKQKQDFLYLPGVKGFELSYNIEHEKGILKVNALIKSRDLFEEVSMLLISLDVVFLAKGWQPMGSLMYERGDWVWKK